MKESTWNLVNDEIGQKVNTEKGRWLLEERKNYSLRGGKTENFSYLGTEVSKLYGGLHCQEGETKTKAVFERQDKTNESVVMLRTRGTRLEIDIMKATEGIMLMGICQNVRSASYIPVFILHNWDTRRGWF